MSDVMLYVMVVLIFGMFGWAAFEYAKAGYHWWREHHGKTPQETPNPKTTRDGLSQLGGHPTADNQDSVDAA